MPVWVCIGFFTCGKFTEGVYDQQREFTGGVYRAGLQGEFTGSLFPSSLQAQFTDPFYIASPGPVYRPSLAAKSWPGAVFKNSGGGHLKARAGETEFQK